MTRVRAVLSKVPFLGVLALVTAGVLGCYGEVDGDAEYPPPAYIATTSPVYYEGRPAYYYGNRWYYRNGGGWGHYRSEPRYLNQYRGQSGGRGVAPGRRYERRR